jgi:hypothetical protein
MDKQGIQAGISEADNWGGKRRLFHVKPRTQVHKVK